VLVLPSRLVVAVLCGCEYENTSGHFFDMTATPAFPTSIPPSPDSNDPNASTGFFDSFGTLQILLILCICSAAFVLCLIVWRWLHSIYKLRKLDPHHQRRLPWWHLCWFADCLGPRDEEEAVTDEAAWSADATTSRHRRRRHHTSRQQMYTTSQQDVVRLYGHDSVSDDDDDDATILAPEEHLIDSSDMERLSESSSASSLDDSIISFPTRNESHTSRDMSTQVTFPEFDSSLSFSPTMRDIHVPDELSPSQASLASYPAVVYALHHPELGNAYAASCSSAQSSLTVLSDSNYLTPTMSRFRYPVPRLPMASMMEEVESEMEMGGGSEVG